MLNQKLEVCDTVCVGDGFTLVYVHTLKFHALADILTSLAAIPLGPAGHKCKVKLHTEGLAHFALKLKLLLLPVNCIAFFIRMVTGTWLGLQPQES